MKTTIIKDTSGVLTQAIVQNGWASVWMGCMCWIQHTFLIHSLPFYRLCRSGMKPVCWLKLWERVSIEHIRNTVAPAEFVHTGYSLFLCVCVHVSCCMHLCVHVSAVHMSQAANAHVCALEEFVCSSAYSYYWSFNCRSVTGFTYTLDNFKNFDMQKQLWDGLVDLSWMDVCQQSFWLNKIFFITCVCTHVLCDGRTGALIGLVRSEHARCGVSEQRMHVFLIRVFLLELTQMAFNHYLSREKGEQMRK